MSTTHSDSYEGRFQGFSALLVENDPVNQLVASEMLTYLGMQVETVSDGADAIAAFQQRRVDVILMDQHLPKVNGDEAAKRIRDLEGTTDTATPIIAHSNSSGEPLALGVDSPFDAEIDKPFVLEDLANTISTYLNDKADAQSPLWNPEALNRLRSVAPDGAERLISKLLEMYRSQAPNYVRQITKGFKSNDLESVRLVAHTLKSTSANIGADGVSAVAKTIETQAKDGEVDSAQIEALNNTLEETLRVLGSMPASNSKAQKRETKSSTDVLIIDDDPAFRLSLSETLGSNGFDTAEVDSGTSGLVYLESHAPEVILLDAMMPELDGFEICKRIRSQPAQADVAIIMVTGLDDKASIDAAYEAGASGFLTKPIQYHLLPHYIRFVHRAHETKRQLAQHKELLSSTLTMARVGFWTWQQDTGAFSASLEFVELMRGELDQTDDLDAYLDIIHEEDRARFLAELERVARDKTTAHLNYRVVLTEKILHINQHSHVDLNTGAVFSIVQDVSRQRQAEERVRELAYLDHLTKLPNRTHLYGRLKDRIQYHREQGCGFALMFIDLDGFKDVNDSLGHDLGDELLSSIADRLNNSLRSEDFLARLGGDEFCVIVEGVTEEEPLHNIAQRYLSALDATTTIASQTIRTQASIGISIFPQDGSDSHALLRAADSAMYSAKEEGKNQYAFFSRDMFDRARSRLALGHELREALEEGQFSLHYQPQVEIATGNILGYEALIRWNHPDRGMIPPNAFIPELEELGMIQDLGRFVISQACRQLAIWRDEGVGDLQVSVNIAPKHFVDGSLPETIKDALEANSITGQQLKVEVTETAIQYADSAIDIANQLYQMGIEIQIDDFGSGYSSLGSLKNLPTSFLKIDRMFIKDVCNNPKDVILLGAIVRLAHALDFKVIAEGVEDLDQVNILAELACDYIQGYFYSRPVRAAEVPLMQRQGFPDTRNQIAS